MISIRPMSATDWPAIRRVYVEGIETGNATFEDDAPDWVTWDGSHLPGCRFVAELDDEVVGFAALSPVSERCVFGGVAEVSVYVADRARGSGVGTRLLSELIEASEEAGLWTLQAGMFPENHASVRLHLSAGFRKVGVRERLGRSPNGWRDVVLLERRSNRVGVG